MKFRLQETYMPTPLREDVDRSTNRRAHRLSEDVTGTGMGGVDIPDAGAVTNKSDIADIHKEVEFIDESVDNKQLTEDTDEEDKHLDGETEDDVEVEIGDETELDPDVDESDLDFLIDDEPVGEEAAISLDDIDDVDPEPTTGLENTGIAEEIRTVISAITDNISRLNQLVVDVKSYSSDETVERILNSVLGSENRTVGELQGLLLAFDVPAQAAYEGIESVSNEVAEAGVAASSLDANADGFDADDMSEEDMASYLEIAENYNTLDV